MHQGYTLLELVIVILLIGISIAMSVPSFSHLFERKETNLAIHRITSLMHYARSEAIKKGHRVVVCPSTDGISCGESWQKGQIVIDEISNEVIAVYPALPVGSSLIWRNSFARNNELVFTPMGFADGQKGSFYYVSKDDCKVIIAIEKTGRWRIATKEY